MTVLRTRGVMGDFAPRHVQALQRQIKAVSPDLQFTCLSDVPIPGVETIRLKYKWPTWWAKLELHRPDITGDFLYMDLDTIVQKPIDHFANLGFWARNHGGGSALMYFPDNGLRQKIWDQWIADPERHMREQAAIRRWDTGMLSPFVDDIDKSFEDLFPGQTAAPKMLPDDSPKLDAAHILVFWGRPRPWQREKYRKFYR